MNKEYARPRIVEHREGLLNKFGGTAKTFMDRIDGVRVADLVEQHGSPLFVISEATLRKRYRAAVREFSIQYPRVQFAWSYKTNYLDAVCSVYHQEGAWAEVVSEFEYEKALRLGVPGDRIVFNGPYKPYEALKLAARNRSRIHVDHMDEIFALEKIAAELRRPVEIGIRLNLDAGVQPAWNRFGFNLENHEAHAAVSRIHSSGKLALKGLHCHIGTFILEPTAYATMIGKMTQFATRLREDFSIGIESLDIGGGFPSSNTLHGQYLPGIQANPPIERYAEVIGAELMKHGARFGKPPLLILESGRALVDEAGSLIATVVARKRLCDGTAAIVLDAGVNVLYPAHWYKPDIIPAQTYPDILENTAVYGPLCMNIDVVRSLALLPGLAAGDRVVIRPAGAYTMTQWMQFIRYRPAVVMIDEDQGVHVIRRAENLESVTALESVPRHLQGKRPGARGKKGA